MGTPKSWRNVEIEQEVKYGMNHNNINEMLKSWNTVFQYAYIQHGGIESPEPDKTEHIHLMLKFKNSVPTTAIIAKCKAFNIQINENNLQKMYKWEKAIAYLSHETQDKPVYDRKNIYSNFDFNEIIDKEIRAKALKRNSDRALQIINYIDNGTVKRYNLHEYINAEEYVTYKRDIDRAFEYRLSKMERETERMMQCIFITGDSQTGKTSLAKKICTDRNLDFYVSSGSNDVLDGYNSQPAIILDDLRPSCMSLSDLLKMLDNNTASSVKSRFRNKVLECQLIIITTTMEIESFFTQVFSDQKETQIQLMRRCGLYLKMDREFVTYYVWDKNLREYRYLSKVPNPITAMYAMEEMSKDEMLDYAASLIGATGDGLKELEKGMKESDFMNIDKDSDIPFTA